MTTPNGTSYTQTDFTSSYGEPARRCVPATATRKLLIFCHGNPGSDTTSADTQFTGNSNYATVRNWLIDNGWAFAEARGAGAGWGNQASRDAYRALYTDMSSVLGGVDRTMVIGRSMGGLVGTYLASRDSVISPKCVGFVCLSGTLNLTNRYAIGTAADRAALEAAYGVSGEAAFTAAVADYDPMLVPAGTWSGRRAIQQYATGDTTVPPSGAAIPWMDKYGGELTYLATQVTSGGDHNSAAGQDLAQADATVAFMAQVADAALVSAGRSVTRIRAPYGGQLRDVAAVWVNDGGTRRQVSLENVRVG